MNEGLFLASSIGATVYTQVGKTSSTKELQCVRWRDKAKLLQSWRCLQRSTPTHLLFRRTHLLFRRTHLLFRRTHLLFRRTHLLFRRTHLLFRRTHLLFRRTCHATTKLLEELKPMLVILVFTP
ncbi:MAG: hypothetical protein KME55_00370 [Nostoc indistinguendum CM1-VF10]|nr:hypothetical protein [Nostoc indistinguendum CM1-VF10]